MIEMRFTYYFINSRITGEGIIEWFGLEGTLKIT